MFKIRKCNLIYLCLRRTSATFLVDSGGDITTLKRHGGWKSSSVAEGYIEESIENKKRSPEKYYNSMSLAQAMISLAHQALMSLALFLMTQAGTILTLP